VDVGDAIALDVLAAVGQDTDGHARDAVPGHASLDLCVEFTEARVCGLRGGSGGCSPGRGPARGGDGRGTDTRRRGVVKPSSGHAVWGISRWEHGNLLVIGRTLL